MTPSRLARRWVSRNRKALAVSVLGVALAAALVATGMAMVPGSRPYEPTQLNPLQTHTPQPPATPPTIHVFGAGLPPDALKREAQRHAIQQELAAGREVVLVGKTGPPRWHEWAMGHSLLAPSKGWRDGTYGFSTNGLSVLTLVRDPMMIRYRFEAELCHEGTIHDLSFVGVFVLYEEHYGKNEEAAYRLLGADYSEFRSDAERLFPQAAADHRLGFSDSLFRQAKPGEWIVSSGREFAPVHKFDPVEKPNRWRGIAVDVSPTGLTLFWKSDAGAWVKVGHWTPADLEVHRRLQQDRLEQIHPGSGIRLNAWTPRSPLGLYARSGGLSFRNVRLTPKPQEI